MIHGHLVPGVDGVSGFELTEVLLTDLSEEQVREHEIQMEYRPVPIPVGEEYGIHKLSNGDTVILTSTGRPVLFGAGTREHIEERHVDGATVAGSRFYEDENLELIAAVVAEELEGYGLKNIEWFRRVGTDAVWPINKLERVCSAYTGKSVKDDIQVYPGQAEDRSQPDFNPRAGAAFVGKEKSREYPDAVGRPTKSVNVVFAPPPATRDAFPGAEEVLEGWELARKELGLTDEQMAQAAGVITMFPGVPTPKLPTDPWLQPEEREESQAFWGGHAFVEASRNLLPDEYRLRKAKEGYEIEAVLNRLSKREPRAIEALNPSPSQGLS